MFDKFKNIFRSKNIADPEETGGKELSTSTSLIIKNQKQKLDNYYQELTGLTPNTLEYKRKTNLIIKTRRHIKDLQKLYDQQQTATEYVKKVKRELKIEQELNSPPTKVKNAPLIPKLPSLKASSNGSQPPGLREGDIKSKLGEPKTAVKKPEIEIPDLPDFYQPSEEDLEKLKKALQEIPSDPLPGIEIPREDEDLVSNFNASDRDSSGIIAETRGVYDGEYTYSEVPVSNKDAKITYKMEGKALVSSHKLQNLISMANDLLENNGSEFKDKMFINGSKENVMDTIAIIYTLCPEYNGKIYATMGNKKQLFHKENKAVKDYLSSREDELADVKSKWDQLNEESNLSDSENSSSGFNFS